MKRKTGDKTTLAWLWAVAKGKKRFVGLLFLVQVILGVSGMGYALFLRGLVNQAVKRDMGGFRGYVLLLAGLVVLQFILRSLSRFLEEYSRASLENALKQRLFRQLLTKDYASVTATHSGEWLNRLTSDTVVVADGMSQILPGADGFHHDAAGGLCAGIRHWLRAGRHGRGGNDLGLEKGAEAAPYPGSGVRWQAAGVPFGAVEQHDDYSGLQPGADRPGSER